MLKMWTFLGIISICFTGAYSFGNESLLIPNIVDFLKFEPPAGISETCSDHFLMYLEGIKKGDPWAFQMIDSITKFPDGILMFRKSIPGHYDECVNAVNEKFSGKHCMVELKLNFQKKKSKLAELYFQEDQKESLVFNYGICVPSTCNSTDIKIALSNLDLQNVVEVDLNETDCSVSGFRPFRTEDWVTVAVLAIILIIALGSTTYDLYQRFIKKEQKPSQLWSSFSIYTNGKQLFSISQSTSQLKCLHGIRFLSMCWVILCHSYFSFLFGSAINMIEIPKLLKDESFVPVSNGFVSVDSFFFLSGLLVCLVFFRDIAKKKTFDVPVAFIHRYMRLTPPFALLMLIQGTIISRIGDGPFWNRSTDMVENACRESWWSGLLYVQNYVKPDAMCLGQAWYLSADMQMYWVSPLILYPILWFPAYAPYFILLLVVAAASTNFAITYVNNLGPNLLVNWNLFTMDQFKKEYVPFHTRMAPWLIGLATGYIICGMQAKKIKIKMPKICVAAGWIATGFLFGGSIFGIVRFFSNDYSQIEASLYLTFHRVGWALGLAWVVIACVGGFGGPVNDLLSLDFFQPLGKLSYCNFLIHMTIQNYRINSSRTNQYLRHFEIVYSYFGDILISNIISIPVTLLLEFPFTSIDRYFFQKLVIFPLPRPSPSVEKEITEVKIEKPEETVDLDKEKDK